MYGPCIAKFMHVVFMLHDVSKWDHACIIVDADVVIATVSSISFDMCYT